MSFVFALFQLLSTALLDSPPAHLTIDDMSAAPLEVQAPRDALTPPPGLVNCSGTRCR